MTLNVKRESLLVFQVIAGQRLNFHPSKHYPQIINNRHAHVPWFHKIIDDPLSRGTHQKVRWLSCICYCWGTRWIGVWFIFIQEIFWRINIHLFCLCWNCYVLMIRLLLGNGLFSPSLRSLKALLMLRLGISLYLW